MKKLLASLLAIAMALSLAACAPRSAADSTPPGESASPSCPPGESASPGVSSSNPAAEYRLEKLNEVSDMVLNRQIVPADYFRYLDETVAGKAEAYNNALANAKMMAVRYAKEWADTFRNMSPEDDWYDAAYAGYGRYLEEGDNYFRFIEEFSTALLYPNHTDFTMFGAVVGYPAGCEAGGSGGLWASGFYLDQAPMDELTAAVDGLLDAMDAAREITE